MLSFSDALWEAQFRWGRFLSKIGARKPRGVFVVENEEDARFAANDLARRYMTVSPAGQTWQIDDDDIVVNLGEETMLAYYNEHGYEAFVSAYGQRHVGPHVSLPEPGCPECDKKE